MTGRRLVLLTVGGALVVAVFGAFAVFGAPAPAAPTITAGPANPTNATSASFTFSAPPTGGSNQCRLDAAAFGACTTATTQSYATLPVGTHTFQVQNVSGGKTSSATSYTWSIDTTAPTISSISRADASPTHASVLRWTVTFSEPVRNVAQSNFTPALLGTGGTAPTITSATPTGSATWTVTMSTAGTTGSNTATVGLDLTSKGAIQDAAGNGLAGATPVRGQAYVFDTQAPNVASIARVSPALTNSSSASWTVTFGEPVVGVAPGNFSLVQGGGITGTPTVTGASGSGTTWTVSASTGTSTPASGAAVSLQLNLTAASGIADVAGNALSGLFSGSAYQVDKVAPAPVFDSMPPDPSSVSTSSFSWHDTEPGVTYLCSTENGPFSSCASPLSFVVATTSNGQHRFAVEAVDAAGNVSQANAYSWRVDKGSIQNFTIDGNASGLLYPGGPTRSIAVTFRNPNSIPIFVTGLSVALRTADFPVGCSSAAFTITQASLPAAGVQVPANGTVTLPAQGAGAPTVQMASSGNQDACKNVQFHFDYSGSAHS